MDRGQAIREESGIGERPTKEGRMGFIIFLGMALLLTLAMILEENIVSPRGFYERSLDQKIVQCEPGAWIYTTGVDVKASNDRAQMKARFYEEERERLIALMEEQALGKDPLRVDDFLRWAFSDYLQSRSLRAHR